MKHTVALCLGLLLPSIAHARIGETLEQCKQRYGDPVSPKFSTTVNPRIKQEQERGLSADNPGESIRFSFKKGAWRIGVIFVDGVCEKIDYEKESDKPIMRGGGSNTVIGFERDELTDSDLKEIVALYKKAGLALGYTGSGKTASFSYELDSDKGKAKADTVKLKGTYQNRILVLETVKYRERKAAEKTEQEKKAKDAIDKQKERIRKEREEGTTGL